MLRVGGESMDHEDMPLSTCQRCNGRGGRDEADDGPATWAECPECDGHGSARDWPDADWRGDA